ncbi:MAG: hypothetical protein QM703_10600 [Gemmatales bacterium]
MSYIIESGATTIISTVLLVCFSGGSFAAFMMSMDEPVISRR